MLELAMDHDHYTTTDISWRRRLQLKRAWFAAMLGIPPLLWIGGIVLAFVRADLMMAIRGFVAMLIAGALLLLIGVVVAVFALVTRKRTPTWSPEELARILSERGLSPARGEHVALLSDAPVPMLHGSRRWAEQPWRGRVGSHDITIAIVGYRSLDDDYRSYVLCTFAGISPDAARRLPGVALVRPSLDQLTHVPWKLTSFESVAFDHDLAIHALDATDPVALRELFDPVLIERMTHTQSGIEWQQHGEWLVAIVVPDSHAPLHGRLGQETPGRIGMTTERLDAALDDLEFILDAYARESR